MRTRGTHLAELHLDDDERDTLMRRGAGTHPRGRWRCDAGSFWAGGSSTEVAASRQRAQTVAGSFVASTSHDVVGRFLNMIDRSVPEQHPRFTLHFTPICCSWLNLVGHWIPEPTTKWLSPAQLDIPDGLAGRTRAAVVNGPGLRS
jgi:hypothetical protein